jgi:hypothetical protein
MSDWHTIEVSELDRLQEAIVSVVEHRTDYGRDKPDWDRIVREVEESEDHLDLGDSMRSPVVMEIIRRGRAVLKDLRENG